MNRESDAAAGQGRQQPRCPICKRDANREQNPFRPFCSERCRLIDLGKWAADEYRIAGSPIVRDAGENKKDE